MMIQRRRMMGGKSSLLPVRYTELQWIRNPSISYIEMNVDANIASRIKVKCRMIKDYASVMMCTSRVYSNSPRFNLATNACYISSTTSDNVTFNYQLITNHIYEIIYDSGLITYHDLTSGSVTNFTFSGTGIGDVWKTFYLFRQGYPTYYNFPGDIFEFELESGNTHIHLIPCINDSNIVGMYDLISNSFYTSPNAKSFVAGDIVRKGNEI